MHIAPLPPIHTVPLQVPQVAVAYLFLSLAVVPNGEITHDHNKCNERKMIKKQKIIIKKIIMYRIFSFYSSINWSLHRKTAELVKCSLLEKVKFFCSEDGGGVGLE